MLSLSIVVGRGIQPSDINEQVVIFVANIIRPFEIYHTLFFQRLFFVWIQSELMQFRLVDVKVALVTNVLRRMDMNRSPIMGVIELLGYMRLLLDLASLPASPLVKHYDDRAAVHNHIIWLPDAVDMTAFHYMAFLVGLEKGRRWITYCPISVIRRTSR